MTHRESDFASVALMLRHIAATRNRSVLLAVALAICAAPVTAMALDCARAVTTLERLRCREGRNVDPAPAPNPDVTKTVPPQPQAPDNTQSPAPVTPADAQIQPPATTTAPEPTARSNDWVGTRTATTCPAPGQALQLTTDRLSEKRNNLFLDIGFPQIANPQCPATRWANDRIWEHVSRWLGCVSNPAGEGCSENMVGGYSARLANAEVLSVSFNVDLSNRGMAQPGRSRTAVNLDLRAQRTLQLADLFIAGSDYLDRLSRYCIPALQRQLAQAYESSGRSMTAPSSKWIEDGAAPMAHNYKVWTLTPEGLAITFVDYQVAAYAYGPQEVVVPYAELQSILRPDGVIEL